MSRKKELQEALEQAHQEDHTAHNETRLHRVKADLRREKSTNKSLAREIHLLQERLSSYEKIDERPASKPIIIRPHKRQTKKQAVPIVGWSDWHVDEDVDPDTLALGFNEYTREIAQESIYTLARNTVKVVNLDRSHSQIDTIVVHLGGDFYSGHIHEELKWSTSMTPIESVFWVEDRIAGALNYLVKHGGFKRIICVCSPGNHGRDVLKKPLGGSAWKRSYEWLMYAHLQRLFDKHDVVEFHLGKAYHSYIKVFDLPIRFHHGDGINYRDGIGGLTIPGNKLIDKWNRSRPAYLDVFGHWHSFYSSWGRAIVNGSLIGWSPFGERFGMANEPPIQSYTLISGKHMLEVGRRPIFAR